MPSYPNQGAGLTNPELLEYLELPEDILTALQTEQGTSFSAAANEFISALMNKVLYQQVATMEFTNPFKKYDGFPINYGDTIENVFVELPKGYKFNKDATDPFTKAVPSVKSLYATINYELQYETTIQDSLLRRAAVSEYGFMNLIDSILSTLSKSMSFDEYKGTIYMLNNEDIFADGIEEIEKGVDDTATAKKVTETIVNTVSAFKIPMTANNKLGVLNAARPENCLLVIKYGLLNSINLDYLTGVFNLSKVDLINNIIEVDGFQVAKPGDETNADQTDDDPTLVGEDIDFMIIDARGFDNHVALQDGGMIYNPKGKYTNHFMNLWKIVSFKYFYNARAFKLVEPSNDNEEVGG